MLVQEQVSVFSFIVRAFLSLIQGSLSIPISKIFFCIYYWLFFFYTLRSLIHPIIDFLRYDVRT